MFSTDFLLASVLWGTIGVGCLGYGKKQGLASALIAGFALISASIFIQSAWMMSGVSILCLGGMIWAIKQGY